MKDQFAWNAYSALHMPSFQVQGLRKAGLNPMLAVGKGISSPPPITSSPGSQDQASSAKMNSASQSAVAAAQVYNLHTASAKNLADAELARAQEETERNKPENLRTGTRKMEQEILNIIQEEGHIAAKTGKADSEMHLANQQRSESEAREDFLRQQSTESRARSNLLAQQVIQSRADTARAIQETDKALKGTIE